MIRYLPIFFIFLIHTSLSSQNNRDSLLYKISISNEDTNLVNIYHDLSYHYYQNGLYEETINNCQKTISLSKKLNYKLGVFKGMYLLSMVYSLKEDYNNAIIYAQNCIKIAEERKSVNLMASVSNQIGNIFIKQKNPKKAIIYYKKSIELAKTIMAYDVLDASYSNLGGLYQDDGNLDSSLYFYNQSLNLSIKLNDSVAIADSYTNIGTIYYNKKDYVKAEKYFKDALTIYLKYNTQYQLAISYINIASVYDAQYKYTEGEELYIKAIEISKQLKSKSLLSSAYEALASNYYNNHNYQEAYNAYAVSKSYSDSAYTEEMSLQTSELQTKYETEKKEQENQVLTLGNKNKQLIIYFVLGGCALLLALVFFIFKGYKNKQKANKLLEEKNEIIHHQKAIVEEQHQDITDSIKYAQRIQGAILPPKNMWQKILPNSFVLYMPKDILSGDFYWIEETKDYIYVAAADCTGHGVPGALISIVNFNLLNKAVLEKNLVTPSDILDTVNLLLTESLHQTIGESAVRDGMDVALIAINKHSNEVLFAGANNPIYIVSHDELKQIKGDKFPVGAFVEDQIQKFTTKRFTVEKGDTIYLFSDGFADQFGGEKGKKYKYSPFQERLKVINDLPLTEQSDTMKNEFLKWKGAHEQVDDVLLIGIKIE